MIHWPGERAPQDGEIDTLMAGMSADERQSVAWVFRCHKPLALGQRLWWLRWYANHYRWHPVEAA